MKRLWNAVAKQTKDANYQQKAVRHVEQMEKTNTHVKAPMHEKEKAHFDRAQKDEKLKKIVAEKDESLVENMNKITIKSTAPVERWTSTKDLPTRDSEYLHRNDPVWEFGFYEPPVERIPKNKLMFREALEFLRARQELEDEGSTPAAAKRREVADSVLSSLPAVERVDPHLLDTVYQYFRPFERKDTQKVVSKADLALLQDTLKGHSDQRGLTDGARDNVRHLLERNKKAVEDYDKLDIAEKEQFREAVRQLRDSEHERLHKRLGEIQMMESEFTKAVKEATEKTKKDEENEKK